MRKVIVSVSVVFLLIISCNSKKSAAPLSDSILLYQISGNGLMEPSYIFGTLHFVPKDQFYIPDILMEKLLEVDALVIETNIDIPIKQQIAMAQRSILPDSKTIKDYLPADAYEETLNYMLDSLNFSEGKAEKYMHLKPLYLMGPLLIGNYGRVESYEKEFVKKAEKNDKEIRYLEPVEFQLDLLDSIPIEAQVKDFSVYKMLDEYEEMLAIYLEQDLDKLESYITNTDEYKDYEEMIITIRNKNWIPQLVDMMNNNSLFIAVGAGHLFNEKGVLGLLEAEGYSVEQISLP